MADTSFERINFQAISGTDLDLFDKSDETNTQVRLNPAGTVSGGTAKSATTYNKLDLAAFRNQKRQLIPMSGETIATGDDTAKNLLAHNATSGEWEQAEFGMPYDGHNIVILGEFEGSFNSGDVGYKLYRQADGTISTSVRASEYYIGFVYSTSLAYIGVLGGSDKEYTDNMDAFFAIPGASTKIRLKIDMPDSADGVMIRRSTSPYDNSGITWGDEVANITNDTSYDGDNEWYEDSGLTNGTRYYYKAFPYKGSVYNVTDGSNESSCKAGGLAHEYWFENNGNDAVGSENLTANNITYQSGLVGNEAVLAGGSGSYFSTTAELFDNTVGTLIFSVSFDGFTTGTAGDNIFDQSESTGDGRRDGWGVDIFSDKLSVYQAADNYSGSWNRINFAYTFATDGTRYICVLKRNGNTFTLKINNVNISSTGSISTPTSGNPSLVGRASTGVDYLDGTVDQMRIITGRITEDYEDTNFYNGGDYC